MIIPYVSGSKVICKKKKKNQTLSLLLSLFAHSMYAKLQSAGTKVN